MKRTLYNLLTYGSQAAIWPTKFFSKKMQQFIDGRSNVFQSLSGKITPSDTTLWFHCASLGEFEQGLPIMEAFKKKEPNIKIVVTFFSPSGYEIKKHTPIADVVTYLPYDTPKNVRRFLDLMQPQKAFFVKYEFWPNYLFELKHRKIETYLISGLFRENQVFFKSHGSFMRKALTSFSHFFVQDSNSKNLLHRIGFENVTLSGDTRFDRVSHQIEKDNALAIMDSFLKDEKTICIVCGSTWPEDETVLLPYINAAPKNVKWVIAPHKISPSKIQEFINQISQKTVIKYSEYQANKEPQKLSNAHVLVVDTIGLLTKIYSYASIAYVGGAMGTTGLHNILEPATFGVPIVIGNNFDKFPEAKKLEDLAGLYSVENAAACTEMLQKLVEDQKFREKTGMICGHFINSNTGATEIIMNGTT